MGEKLYVYHTGEGKFSSRKPIDEERLREIEAVYEQLVATAEAQEYNISPQKRDEIEHLLNTILLYESIIESQKNGAYEI